jgi:hypothetical protein
MSKAFTKETDQDEDELEAGPLHHFRPAVKLHYAWRSSAFKK